MHDSLAKTVSGIGFAALALSRRIERDPEGAAVEARRLAEDARHATRQAREIIVGLRADAGETLPLSEAARRSRALGGRRRVVLDLAVEDVGELHPATARELEWISRESLANVAAMPAPSGSASAAPARWRGRCSRWPTTARASSPRRARRAAAGRHFGVGGMRERALLAGGDLSVESAPGEGCVLWVWVPTEIVPREVGPAETRVGPRRSADRVPGRSVPGYTWQ